MSDEQQTADQAEQAPAGGYAVPPAEGGPEVVPGEGASEAAPDEGDRAAEGDAVGYATPAPAEEAPAEEAPAEAASPAEEAAPPAEEAPAPAGEERQVGPRILGVAQDPKPLPIVKKKLREKPPPPKREPLPWPELRAIVADVRKGADTAELKELFRLLPNDVREEVVVGVREFRKGARRPLSQHAAKSLARAVHTSRRLKKNAGPSPEVSAAIAQAIVGELIASLDVEQAAEVILPKRDLLEREARNARRRARDEEDKRRDEQRRKRREDAKGARGTQSFGSFSGTKIQGLDEIAAAFGLQAEEEAPAPAEEPAGEASAAEAEITGYAVPPAEESPAAPDEAPAEEPTPAASGGEAPAEEVPAAAEEAPAEVPAGDEPESGERDVAPSPDADAPEQDGPPAGPA